jgi:hypothetical protein
MRQLTMSLRKQASLWDAAVSTAERHGREVVTGTRQSEPTRDASDRSLASLVIASPRLEWCVESFKMTRACYSNPAPIAGQWHEKPFPTVRLGAPGMGRSYRMMGEVRR